MLNYILILSILDQTHKFDLTCAEQFANNAGDRPNNNTFNKTSLFGFVFLVTCITIAFSICLGWFLILYCRYYIRRRIKKKLKKALAKSAQELLDKTPIITYKSNKMNNNSNDDEPICSICLEAFVDDENLRKLGKIQ